MIWKNILITCSAVFFSSCQGPVDNPLPFEAADPDAPGTEVWQNVEHGLHAMFGSVDIAYIRSAPPGEKLTDTLHISGWKGEIVNGKIVTFSRDEIEDIDVVCSDLESADSYIGAENIIPGVVKYVLTDEFLDGCGRRIKDSLPVHLYPDMIDTVSHFSFDKPGTRPVWLSVQIPQEASPGTYFGPVSIVSGTDTVNLVIELDVSAMKLPPPSEWSFHLDLWQNPWAVARYHNVEPWSPEHWDLIKPLLRLLASAGQKCITTTLNDSPWGGQTFDPFGSMVGWLRNSNGTWDYDYSLFDEWVTTAMECGITDQINCYSMVPWNNRFVWYEQDSAKFVETSALPGTERYEELWTPFLYDFREHLREMGWLNKTCIAMDERKREDMVKIIDLLQRTVPEIQITLAGGIQEGVDDYIYDLSIAIGNNPPMEKVSARVASERPTTFYTCCARPEHPNNFTFSPPADNAIIGWFAAAHGYNGFLRWAYNSWVEDPVYDSRFRTWPSGDTYMVYPGARSSVRFERLREGIQDYEKLMIILEKLDKDSSDESAALKVEIDAFLRSITLESLEETGSDVFVKRGKELLIRATAFFN